MTVVSFPRRRDTVVFLHSSASSGRQWDAIAASLSAATIAHAPPLLGYDARAPWPLDRAVTLDYFMSDYVDHLEHHLAQVLG